MKNYDPNWKSIAGPGGFVIKNPVPLEWNHDANDWTPVDRCVYCGDRENVTNGYHGQPECGRCTEVRDRNGETLHTF
jgi:hypothetical protein